MYKRVMTYLILIILLSVWQVDVLRCTERKKVKRGKLVFILEKLGCRFRIPTWKSKLDRSYSPGSHFRFVLHL